MNVASKPPPTGWPRMSASLSYREAAKAIDFLCKAFGFEVQLRVDGEAGKIEHSELVLGGALITTGDVERGRPWRKPPREVDGVTSTQLCFYVDDVDAHCARAVGIDIVDIEAQLRRVDAIDLPGRLAPRSPALDVAGGDQSSAEHQLGMLDLACFAVDAELDLEAERLAEEVDRLGGLAIAEARRHPRPAGGRWFACNVHGYWLTRKLIKRKVK